MVEAAARAKDQLAAEPGWDRLIGVGLGLSGLIGAERGVCVESHRTQWRNVPLSALLQGRLGVPVWIDNDVNAFATAERLVGQARQTSNFFVVTLGRGVGAALVLEGRLFRGTRGGAGELGHTLSERGGRLCECGLQGCLEAYTSSPNLVAQFNECLTETDAGRSITHDEELAELAAHGNSRAEALLQNASGRLGESIANLANLFDPELIIFGGEGVAIGQTLLGAARRAFERRRLIKTAPVTFLVDSWSEDTWAKGAAGLVVEQFFEGFPTLAEAAGSSGFDWI